MDDVTVNIDELVVDSDGSLADPARTSALLSGVETSLDAPLTDQVSRAIAASLNQLTAPAWPS